MGAKHGVNNGRSTRFWLDWWVGTGPLRSRFPNLFLIATQPGISVAGAFPSGDWVIPFRRTLGQPEIAEWQELLRIVGDTQLSEGQDSFSWHLEPSRKFSVKSLYSKLCLGTPRKHFREIWGIAIPLKIRVFLWQLAWKRLPSCDNIIRRRGPSNGLCSLCGQFEDTNHIFFGCSLAKFLWSAVRELLHCS